MTLLVGAAIAEEISNCNKVGNEKQGRIHKSHWN
jgi:hypothetical protein